MRRTWTIIGVRDVPRSFRWYQALFGLRQLALEVRQALRERRDAAAQLGRTLLIGLKALLGRSGLGLDLGSGLRDLRQLLLLGLEVL